MINRLKNLFGSKPELKPTHKIVRCETRQVDSKDGPKSVIMIGADLYEAQAVDKLMVDLVERFKVHRMISPPETSVMVITIIGPCQILDVATSWQKLAAGDKVAAFWMSRMEKADIGVASTSNPASAMYHSILPNRAPSGA